jgi:hypothetical protein
MTGTTTFQTRIDIPPGQGGVSGRLRLNGHFTISSGRFSKLNVEKKIATLSERARGEPGDDSSGSVVSNFAGEFSLQNAVMSFWNMTFSVPGALVQLDGTYALRGEAVNFLGTLRLESKLSQTVRGWKSTLLKPLNPFFKKAGAGTVLPIKITGTGHKPRFGLDMRRLF